MARCKSSYGDLVNSKGLDGAVKLGDSKFWDNQYSKDDNKKTEWYINATKAASFLHQILLQRDILHPKKLNILLEIGCGSAPLILPLTEYFKKSKFKILGFATDASNVCISELKRSHAKSVSDLKNPKQTILRTDANGNALTFISRGVYCSVLDIKDLKAFSQYMKYFPITDIDSYKSQVGFKKGDNLKRYRTNIIAIDKGCLDALIWDKNVELVKNVLGHCDAVVSISGEDPDIRLDYYQTQYGKSFSVHFLEDSEIYGYSLINKGKNLTN